MAVTSSIYGTALGHLARGLIDWEGSLVKALLTTDAYVPDIHTHSWVSAVTNEVSGTGYTAGGIEVVEPRLTYSTTAGRLDLGGDDLVYPSMSASGVRRAVFYIAGADAASSPLVGWIDLGADVSPVDQSLTIGVGDRLFSLSAA